MQPVVKVHRKSRNGSTSLQPRSMSNKHTLVTSKRQREYMQQLQHDGLYCVLTTVKSPAPPENPIGKTISPPPSLEEEDSPESGCSSFSESSESDESSDTEKPKKKKRGKEGKKKSSPKPRPKPPERPPSVFVCQRNGIASFGRSPDNSGLVLPDPFVSQRHFQVSEEGSQFYLSDQGSMNGTFLRKKVDYTREGRVLTATTVFVIGQTEFQVSALRDQSTTPEELAERKISPSSGFGLKLNFKHKTAVVENKTKEAGPDVRYRQTMRSVIIKPSGCVIGRAADCLIRLVDETVDPHQAEIFLRNGKFYIRNFASDTSHGFWTRLSLSGVVSASILLEDGDVVKVGASELTVEIRTRPPQPKILFPKQPPTCAIDIGTAVDGNWLKQKEMQDRLIVIDGYGGNPCNGFFGIFDGHQERRVADFAAAALYQNLLDEIEQATKGLQSRVRFCPSSPVTIIPSTPPSSPSPDSKHRSFFDIYQKTESPMVSSRAHTKPPFTVPSSPSLLESPVDPKGKITASAPFPIRRYPFTPSASSVSRNLDDLFNPPSETATETTESTEGSEVEDIHKSAPAAIQKPDEKLIEASSIPDTIQERGSSGTATGGGSTNSHLVPPVPIPPSTTLPILRGGSSNSDRDSESIGTTTTSVTGSTHSEESRSDSGTGVNMPDCLVSAYEKTARQIEGLGDISKYGGSTALTCILWKDEKTNQMRLYTANIGDSRAVLCRDGKAVALSYDHVARDPVEQERVRQRGGTIRNNMLGFCLELSRAFGDRGLLHYGLTSDPHISEAVIGPKDEFLLLGSDGIWDVFSNRDAVDFVKKILADKSRSLRSCDEIARSLLTKALHKQDCNDNLSLVIVRFRPDDLEVGGASVSPSSPSPSRLDSPPSSSEPQLSPPAPIRAIALSPPSPLKRSPQGIVSQPSQKSSPSVPTLRSNPLGIIGPDVLLEVEPTDDLRRKSGDLSGSLSQKLTLDETPFQGIDGKQAEFALSRLPTNTLSAKRVSPYYRVSGPESGELSDPFSPSSPFYSSPSSSLSVSPGTESQETATA